jgi:hypothetical protein
MQIIIADQNPPIYIYIELMLILSYWIKWNYVIKYQVLDRRHLLKEIVENENNKRLN